MISCYPDPFHEADPYLYSTDISSCSRLRYDMMGLKLKSENLFIIYIYPNKLHAHAFLILCNMMSPKGVDIYLHFSCQLLQLIL